MTGNFTVVEKLLALGLSAEQLKGVLSVLAVELAPYHDRLKKDRERKFRSRNQGPSDDDPQNVCGQSEDHPQVARDVGINNLPSSEPKKLPLSPSKPKSDEHELFADFWAVYPKRSGPADRKPATKAFAAAIKRTDFETIYHGAKAYAADMTAKGKIGTEYVKQARTWLNADGWTEYQSLSPLVAVEQSTKVYVKYGTDAGDAWERHYRVVLKKVPPRDFKGGWWHPTEYPEERSAA